MGDAVDLDDPGTALPDAAWGPLDDVGDRYAVAAIRTTADPEIRSEMTTVVLLCLLALAYANGANDVSKGVGTLVGSGLATYRRAWR